MVLLRQAGAQAAPVQVLRLGQRGRVAQRLEGAGGPLVIALHMSRGLERLRRRALVTKAVGPRIGISPKERGGVVVAGLLHGWGSPRHSLAVTRLRLALSWKDIGTPQVT